MRNFMGKDFVWFVGVVEDRNDPVQMGRVRVRAFGFHSEDKGQIPTDMLPWAVPINGIQSASVSGIGHSPTGIVEGSWVVGFFMDGERAQEPVIFGTIPGVPVDEPDPFTGFNDPFGVFPRVPGIPDTNIAARAATCEEHPARIAKNAGRVNDDGEAIQYPTARPPKITSVAPDRASSYYTLYTWQEKPAADNSLSLYPHNHVYETENGHLIEVDDTEGSERYHRYHPSGTYEEVVVDGTKTVKVIGDNYELLLRDNNVYISGDYNVTVEGDKRELIKGNYHLEVEGDVSFDCKKSWQRKVNFNLETEIGKTRATNIGQNDFLTLIKGDSVEQVATGEKVLVVQKDYTLTVNEDFALTTFGNTQFFATGDYKLTNLGVHYVTSKGNMTIQTAANQTVTVTGTKTETAATSAQTYTAGDIVVAGISHVSHTHTDPAGISGAETSTPN